MDTGKRDARRRKYLSLGSGELVAAGVFATAALYFATPRLPSIQDRMALWSALIPLLVVLVAGGVYWLLARSWVERGAMPRAIVIAYRVLSVASFMLLVGGFVGVIIWWPDSVGTGVPVMLVWIFAAAEYMNYFLVRLAYPVSQWLTTVGQRRTPRLVADMRSASK